MREVELKAAVPDEAALVAHLSAQGVAPRFQGSLLDRRYDRADRALRVADHVLRLRVRRTSAGTDASLEFKGPAAIIDGYKVREETATAIADPEAMHAILLASGFVVTREVDREVTLFDVDGAVVRVERYPRLDVLVEVEGDPRAIERAILRLGMDRASFTAEPLFAFITRFEERTGTRAALCRCELDGDFRYRLDDA